MFKWLINVFKDGSADLIARAGPYPVTWNTRPDPSVPVPLSMCRFLPPSGYETEYPMSVENVYVFLGEIPNMPGHCVVVDHTTNKIFTGYHTDNFIQLEQDEV